MRFRPLDEEMTAEKHFNIIDGASFGQYIDWQKKRNIASLLTVSLGGKGVPVTTPNIHITKNCEILLMSQMAEARTYYSL